MRQTSTVASSRAVNQDFKNEQFGEIRTIIKDNEPWFVGKDVAKVLGYSNTRDAIRKHVEDDDKTTVAICDGGSNYKSKTTIINESGLYSHILSTSFQCRGTQIRKMHS